MASVVVVGVGQAKGNSNFVNIYIFVDMGAIQLYPIAMLARLEPQMLLRNSADSSSALRASAPIKLSQI